MSLTTPYRKAPLRTYGGNKRGHFTVFRDPDSANAKGLGKGESEASKVDIKIAPEPLVNLKNKLGIQKWKTNLRNDTTYETVVSSVEIAQRKLLEMPSYGQATVYPMTRPESKESKSKMVMKLKEKSTNAGVQSALVRASPLQTPATHSIKAQTPKTPPKKKKHMAKISSKQNPSPSHRRTRPSFTKARQTLDYQDFPDIPSPSTSKANSKRPSLHKANPASISSGGSLSMQEPPSGNAGFPEQVLMKGPNLSFMGKPREVVADTTRAAVKFLPTLVQPKTQKVPKQGAGTSKKGNVDSIAGSKWKGHGKGVHIESRGYEEVVDPTDSEDLREGNISRTWKYSPGYHMFGAGESHQHLLYSLISESDADEYEPSDVEMIVGGHRSFMSNTNSRLTSSAKRSGKHSKHRHRQDPFNDDTEQGFDGDVEMLTEEDDYDADENLEVNFGNPSCETADFAPGENNPQKDSDSDLTRTLEGSMTTEQLDVNMVDVRSKVCTPLHVKKYNESVAREIEIFGKKRSLEDALLGSSCSVKRHQAATRKISLIGEPPVDLITLSEDELCSPNYMIVPFAARYDQNKTPSNPRNNKGCYGARI